MSKHRNHDASFKARAAVKGERSVSELAAEYGVHPAMIHQSKTAQIGEETVRSLCAKTEALAVANDLLCKPCPGYTPIA
ncbi:MAG: hypothetical protein QM656_08730 [Paracoccaceae bacterium]